MDERWMTCRACGDVGLRWSRRSEVEWLFGFFVPLRPYRCNSCYARQWGLRRPILNVGTAGLAAVAILVVVIAVRESVFLRPAEDDSIVAPAAATEPAGEPAATPDDAAQQAGPPADDLLQAVEREVPLGAGGESRRPETAAPETLPGAGSRILEMPEQGAVVPQAVEGSGPAAGAEADEVVRAFQGVRAQRTSVGLALVILASRPVTAYEQSFLDNPGRWVFDLPGRWRKGSSQRIAIEFPGVEAVRVGYHPDRLRVVIDLAGAGIELVAVETGPRGLEIHLRAEN